MKRLPLPTLVFGAMCLLLAWVSAASQGKTGQCPPGAACAAPVDDAGEAAATSVGASCCNPL